MSFSKLDEGIIHSSVWSEGYPTRILWITLLAMKDEVGFVAASKPGLIRAANITADEFTSAITCLESPDPNSRTEDYDGRRVEKIEGGWIILNHEKYRLHGDRQRELTRERVRKYREKKRDVTQGNVTSTLPSVSVSVSESVSEKDKEGDCKGKKKKKEVFKIPSVSEIDDYCKTRSNGINAQHFFDYYSARGWLIGKNKMKCWKSAVRTWENRNKLEQKQADTEIWHIPRNRK